ncbi:SH3-domain-containing protein [Cylindrobasidium torrendii FP15055 ss-10]|uniref:SH3-domain-containing protein n=1 Tax=Cylindrobasidium torrendii FP15055 ss-10 TaxID=1314674 RepID=A0A0D7BAK2_9AGAR|nr:SH3-domain-containing protein [Cylindrobasidium torrendii FP15055 ss-10]
MQGADTQALLNHIITSTRSNIEFLVSQHQLSAQDAQAIIAKLPSVEEPQVAALTNSTQNLLLSRAAPPPPAAPVSSLPKARATWGYNEDRQAQSQDPKDLSFRAGDIIEIVSETNPDWWTGRNNGQEGLFPANYVERLPGNPSPAPPAMPRGPGGYSSPPPSGYNAPPQPSYAPTYHPPAGPPVGYQPPYQPPPQPQYQPYTPPPQPQVVQQQEEPKKSRFGFGGGGGGGSGLGNTLAHSAAGGVGFGAGSAVGSGIINSIF